MTQPGAGAVAPANTGPVSVSASAGVGAIVLATELGPLQRLLGTVSLTFDQWVVCTVLGVSIVVVSEIKKRVWRVDLDVADAPAAQPTAAAPAA